MKEPMLNPTLEHPAPDFTELERVLKGEQEPRRVHLIELYLDQEIMQAIYERYIGQPWIPPDVDMESYFRQVAYLYFRLGYDYVATDCYNSWINFPKESRARAEDTAGLSRGQRDWITAGYCLISSRQDYEEFPWDDIQPDLSHCEFTARHLQDGMKMTVSASLFQICHEVLLGYEGLSYKLYDDPELVAQVFDQWGQIIFDYYESVIGVEAVGAIFHADDLGFKTSSLVSPKALRQHVFPWLKKYADLAHEHDKMFWLHSCGNLYKPGIIEDLIEEVGIDALHSFQDVILPVSDFKARYGDRVAALGGLDMDKLCRMDENSLREYIRTILEQCMPSGRYALGSGNSITNFIPLQNYLILLDESRRWSPSHATHSQHHA